MGDRMDELKGKAKQGLGDVTGDEQMKQEGQGEEALARGKREVKIAAEQATGKLKEGLGRMTGDTGTEAQGDVDQMKGEAGRTG